MKPCPQCGKDVYRYPSTMGRNFCSWACRDAARRAKRVNEVDGTALCAKCKEWKPILEFVKGAGGRPHSHCKPCNSDWFAKRRGTPADKRKPYAPRQEPMTAEEKRIRHRELAKEYRESPGGKEYKRWYNKRRIHRLRAGGPMPDKYDIGRLLCEQDGKCAYCGEMLPTVYHIDHKTPVARGGTNDIENLHLTCPRCNLRKGTMTHEEFLVSKRRRPFKQAGPVGKLP